MDTAKLPPHRAFAARKLAAKEELEAEKSITDQAQSLSAETCSQAAAVPLPPSSAVTPAPSETENVTEDVMPEAVIQVLYITVAAAANVALTVHHNDSIRRSHCGRRSGGAGGHG